MHHRTQQTAKLLAMCDTCEDANELKMGKKGKARQDCDNLQKQSPQGPARPILAAAAQTISPRWSSAESLRLVDMFDGLN